MAIVATSILVACTGRSDGERATGGTVSATGNSAEFRLEGFDEVSLRGPDDVVVAIGNEFSVRAEGDPQALEQLEIDVRGDTLRVGRKHSAIPGGTARATVYVTMPEIAGASIGGSGDMAIDTVEAESFAASVGGSGNLAIASLRASRVAFDVAGSGSIEAAGSTHAVSTNIAGSGNIGIGELRTGTLDASIAGSGDVEAYATEAVEASIMGSGNVTVRGGARCSSSALGSGELRCQ